MTNALASRGVFCKTDPVLQSKLPGIRRAISTPLFKFLLGRPNNKPSPDWDYVKGGNPESLLEKGPGLSYGKNPCIRCCRQLISIFMGQK